MAYWERSDRHAKSFAARTSRFGTVDGPLELFSFASRGDRPTKPDEARPGKADPMYFMAGSSLAEAIKGSGKPAGLQLRESIRQGVAICEDWQGMNFLFILEIPAGMKVEAWYGLAKFQPRCEERPCNGSVLAGGWLQYIVDLDERTSKYLRGPIKTGW